MVKAIESNLIIRSRINKPTGTGFTKIRQELESLDKLVDKINKRTIEIKVHVDGGDVAVRDLTRLLSVAAKAQKLANQASRGPRNRTTNNPATPPGGGGPPQPPANLPLIFPTSRGRNTKTRETARYDSQGNPVLTQTETSERNIGRTREIVETTTGDTITPRQTRTFIDEEERQRQRIERRNRGRDVELRDLLARRRDVLQQNVSYGNTRANSLTKRYGFQEIEGRSSFGPLVPGLPSEKDTVVVRRFAKEMADGTRKIVEFNEATGKTKAYIDRNTDAIKAQATAARQARATLRQQQRDYDRLARLTANSHQAGRRELDLLSKGFKQYSSQSRTFDVAGRSFVSTVNEFRKVSGHGALGTLQVEIAKVDSATGRMTSRTLKANDALRAMGDSFTKAVSKVSLWFGATTAVFAVGRSAQFAAAKLKEMEANTIFLARVGSNLSSSLNFSDRLAQAKLLTSEIARQSSVFGADAAAAQRAASIFLRAGQTRIETEKSVRASLLASSIAELDVEEAAKLISSALSQFKLKADDILPTLDSLNTLSNNYKVTTNDLLQAISRSGSVYSASNGKLEQLAATVAIVADRTSRSGSEIGNAIKTIQSRLASPEVSGGLLEKTGISLQNDAGEAKNLTTILLELNNAMQNMTQTEQQSLKVRLAGARQVNILETALNNVVDIVLAEAKALRGSGSATEEAIQNSNSLAAALGRLQGSFIEVTNASGHSIAGPLKDVIGITNGIVKLAGSFDGLAIKLGIMVLAFLAVQFALKKMSDNMAYSTIQALALSGGLKSLASSAASVSASMGSAALGFVKANVAAIALTLAISLIVKIFGAMEQAAAEAAIRIENLKTSSTELLERTRRETKASDSLREALYAQIEAYKRLNDEKKKGKDVSQQERSTLNNINKLTGPEGLGLSTGNFASLNNSQLNQLAKQATGQQFNQLKLQRTAIQKEIKEQESAIDELKKKEAALINQREFNAASQKFTRNLRFDLPFRDLFYGENPWEVLANEAKAFDQPVIENQKQIQKLIDHLKELKRQAAGLDDKTNTSKTAFSKNILNAVKVSEQANRVFEHEKKIGSAQTRIGIGDENSKAEDLRNRIAALTEVQSKYLDSLKSLEGQSDTPLFEKMEKDVTNVTTKIEELNYQLAQIKISQLSKSAEGHFDSLDRVVSANLHNQSAINFINNSRSLGGNKFATYQSQRDEINGLRLQARNLAETRSAYLEFAGDASPEQKAAVVKATGAKIDDVLGRAKELELRSVEEILKIEEEITKERKEQNKETIRSLGLLSDEDKVLFLRHAQFFKQNPNAQFSAEDQFLRGADSNKLLQQFFGSHLATEFDQNNRFERELSGLGIAPKDSEDIRDAQSRLDRELGPQGSEQRRRFLDNAQQDAQRRQNEADDLNGRDRFNGAGLPSSVIPDNFNVNVDLPQDFLKPLVDSFDNAVTKQMTAVRDDLINEIDRIWDAVESANLPNARRPSFQN